MRMGLRQWSALLAAFIILFGAVPSIAAAKEDVSFRLLVKEQDVGFQITVRAHNLDDMYGYDLVVEADRRKLKLTNSKSAITGFSVGPLEEENGGIRFANTKIGKSSGVNGNSDLAAFTFERVANGAASIRLTEVNLVDSELNMVTYEPNLRVLITPSGKIISFHDIAGHWAESVIMEAVEQGIVNGYEDGSFRPERQVTRAEFSVMLVRALNLELPSEAQTSFADNGSIPDWARAYIAAAVEAKVIQGYEDNTFRADRPINREEMSAIMTRAFGIETAQDGAPDFSDADQISDWALPYVAAAAKAKLMNGRGNNVFAPKELATRAEAVAVLMRR